MANLDQVKVALLNQQVLTLLLQECSNKRIGGQLSISPHTVKQHLRPLFVFAGIFAGPKRVELARYVHDGESTVMTPCQGLVTVQVPTCLLLDNSGRISKAMVDECENWATNYRHRWPCWRWSILA